MAESQVPLWTPTAAIKRMRRECDETQAEAMIIGREQLKGLLFDSMEFRRLHALIHNPHTDEFIEAVKLEAAFQREHWKAEHDGGKTDADWFWLIGYLGGKALAAIGLVERADLVRDVEHFRSKALHHIITTAAACLNWHMARTVGTDMRPGIAEPALPNNQRLNP